MVDGQKRLWILNRAEIEIGWNKESFSVECVLWDGKFRDDCFSGVMSLFYVFTILPAGKWI